MPIDQIIFQRMRETETNLSVDIEVELMGPFDREFRPANLAELVMLGRPMDGASSTGPAVLNWYEFMEDSPEPVRDLTIRTRFFEESVMRIGQGMGLLVSAVLDLESSVEKDPMGSYKLYRVVEGEEPLNRTVMWRQEKLDIGPPLLFGAAVKMRYLQRESPAPNNQWDIVLHRIASSPQSKAGKSKDLFGNYEFDLRRVKFIALPCQKLSVNGAYT